MPEHVLAPVRRSFRAVAEVVVPEAAGLSEQQWARAEAHVETALAPRPEGVKRQLRLFLRIVEWGALGRHGRTFSRLGRARRISWLRSLERAPLLAVRRGVWGARTLAFLAVYGLPEVRDSIGYRAHPDGWERRGRAMEPPQPGTAGDDGPGGPSVGGSRDGAAGEPS